MTDDSQNPALSEERAYLENAKRKIQAELSRASDRALDQFRDMLATKTYLAENKADMDHVEKASMRESVDQIGNVTMHSAQGAFRLKKLLKSPYFGRIDFLPAHNGKDPKPIYVGIHSFYDNESERHLVHDWRAPISSMFYDFETGPAHYRAPDGIVNGEIRRKRQYRIEDGALQFMLETSLNIHDNVLQEELSRASSDKMKNIVATIQRDQNAIIRNDRSSVLVIQGAAGSGKTSIALHRIAFLLYRFKDEISSSDVLIISPNKVFGHYISNVLPELGEENIQETTMEGLASELLGHNTAFQSFYQQVAQLLAADDPAYRERIRFKATPEFLERLDEYARFIKQDNFTPAPVRVGRHEISADFVEARYNRMGDLPFAEKLNELVENVVSEFYVHHDFEVKGADRAEARKQLTKMFISTRLETLYRHFYKWLRAPKMLKSAARGTLEYSDVFPFIYFKMRLEGVHSKEAVKHLVIDEMQDYTPVQYRILALIYPCKKTILGDANQSVNPLSSSTADSIASVFPGAEVARINKSYRSTLEISNLAQQVNRNPDLEPIERHGEKPEFHACDTPDAELYKAREIVSKFLDSDYKSLGIVCKTQDQADTLYRAVRNLSDDIHLIDPSSSVFSNGVLVASAHLAKGLEFDQVLIPFASAENYRGDIDRQMLYVAITRAMHRLALTHNGPLSPLLGQS